MSKQNCQNNSGYMNCAIYTRVSTDNQAEVEFNFCQAQAQQFRKIFYPKNKKELLLGVTPSSKIGSPLRISTNYRYNLTKYNSRLQEERFIGTAPWGAPVACVLPVAPLRSGAHSAPALVGWLPASAVRVRLVLRLGLGGGSPSRSVLN